MTIADRFATVDQERSAVGVIKSARELIEFSKEPGDYEWEYLDFVIEEAEVAGPSWAEVAQAIFVDHPANAAGIVTDTHLYGSIDY